MAAGTRMLTGFVAELRTSARFSSPRVGGRSSSRAISLAPPSEEARDAAVHRVDVLRVALEVLAARGPGDVGEDRLVGLAAVGDGVDAHGEALRLRLGGKLV